MCCFSKNKLTVNFYLKTQKHIHETKQPLYSASLCSKRLNQAVQTILRSLLLQSSGILTISEYKRFHILWVLVHQTHGSKQTSPQNNNNKEPQIHSPKTFSKLIRISALPVSSPHIYYILGEINMTTEYDLVSCLGLKKSSFPSLSDVL